MNSLKKLCVVIPVYKPCEELTDAEVSSIKQCFQVLSAYSIYFAGPPQLNFAAYNELAAGFNVQLNFKTFPAECFKSIAGYNKLMLSQSFYTAFSAYQYMLIYQTDAWIFRDDMGQWCDKGYDYIGAPWINWPWSEFAAAHTTLPRTVLSKLGYNKFNLVGNGGFSLRKIGSFVSNLRRFKVAAESFKENEDYFFSFYINSYNPFFKIPLKEEALKFCFDENPDMCFSLNDNQLPMACHAWPKYETFWKKFIVK